MSKNLEKTYNPKEIEAKLYEKWCEESIFTLKLTGVRNHLQR